MELLACDGIYESIPRDLANKSSCIGENDKQVTYKSLKYQSWEIQRKNARQIFKLVLTLECLVESARLLYQTTISIRMLAF